VLIGQFSGVKQMYAVVETGGKQYRVAVGDKLMVEKLDVEEGAAIQLERVLMVCDNGKVEVGTPVLDGTSIGAKVLLQGRGEKIKVYKFKRRKKYRKTQGHRQSFTQLEITSIGDAKAAPEAKVEADAIKPAPQKAKAEQTAKTDGDQLTEINGIGPVIAQKLNDGGIATFQQIADFTAEQIAEIDEKLNFKGRIDREEWVAQAKKLTS
jgi:large subunit ribosomal protein L21